MKSYLLTVEVTFYFFSVSLEWLLIIPDFNAAAMRARILPLKKKNLFPPQNSSLDANKVYSTALSQPSWFLDGYLTLLISQLSLVLQLWNVHE